MEWTFRLGKKKEKRKQPKVCMNSMVTDNSKTTASYPLPVYVHILKKKCRLLCFKEGQNAFTPVNAGSFRRGWCRGQMSMEEQINLLHIEPLVWLVL